MGSRCLGKLSERLYSRKTAVMLEVCDPVMSMLHAGECNRRCEQSLVEKKDVMVPGVIPLGAKTDADLCVRLERNG